MIPDLRLAFRRFRVRPAHSALMILILGIGIGATTAVFSVVDQTLLRPAPFAHADRLVDVIDIDRASLTLLFESFAFKVGVPLDADLVFDARVLPNPHYDVRLRALTGRDAPVVGFLANLPMVNELLSDIRTFVEKWLPSFKEDSRSYLTVAVGCTGGQHRSVYIVEQLASYFSANENVVVRHRQLG